MTVFFGPQNVIDIQNIVTIFIVVAIILDPFARFCKHPPRVPGRFIFKVGIAEAVSNRQVCRQGL